MSDENPAIGPAAFATVEAYFVALNARDIEAVGATLHFPHVLFAGSEVTHYPTAADFTFASFDARTAGQGWSHSTLDGHRVAMTGPDKQHVDIAFTRWRADGSAIAVLRALYILTRIDGRWGIQARSSER